MKQGISLEVLRGYTQYFPGKNYILKKRIVSNLPDDTDLYHKTPPLKKRHSELSTDAGLKNLQL